MRRTLADQRRWPNLATAGVVIVVAIAISGGVSIAQSVGTMIKHDIVDAAARGAVCNDGSPGTYYLTPGTGADADKWVIFLQGGVGCATDAACALRQQTDPELITSRGLPNTRVYDGLLSTSAAVNPDFANYAHVWAHYCSSDIWTGDTQHTINGEVWQFRGHNILEAILQDLEDPSIVGAHSLALATDVIFAGSSAGGMGVVANIDRIADELSWARVVGLADSAWVPDIAPFGPGTVDVRPDAPQAHAYFNAVDDQSCVDANPADPGACMAASFVFPYLSTPVFIYADQRDANHLGTFGILPPVNTPAQRSFVAQYGMVLRQGVAQVPGLFSPAVGLHTAATNERWQSVLIDGQTFQQTFSNWYFGASGAVHLVAGPARPGP